MEMHLELFVKDIETSMDFYQNTLKLELKEKRKYAAEFRFKNAIILLSEEHILPEDHYFDKDSLKGRKGVGTELILKVENVYLYYQHVIDSKYPILETLRKRPWGNRDFRITDPDGYYIRISD